MTDLVTLIMQAATISRLEEECDQVDQEVAQLLNEIEHVSIEDRRHGEYRERFMELLKRRGEIVCKALLTSKSAESAKASRPTVAVYR